MESSPESKFSDIPDGELRACLVGRKCVACEGGVDPIEIDEARRLTQALTGWELNPDGTMISRKINARTFVKVIELVNRLAAIAEEQQHHPDLHVTGYRHLDIVLTTHAIGGLSENDFIVAAQFDEILP